MARIADANTFETFDKFTIVLSDRPMIGSTKAECTIRRCVRIPQFRFSMELPPRARYHALAAPTLGDWPDPGTSRPTGTVRTTASRPGPPRTLAAARERPRHRLTD